MQVLVEKLRGFVERREDPVAGVLHLAELRALLIGEFENAGGAIEIEARSEGRTRAARGTAGASAHAGASPAAAAKHETDDDRSVEGERDTEREGKETLGQTVRLVGHKALRSDSCRPMSSKGSLDASS